MAIIYLFIIYSFIIIVIIMVPLPEHPLVQEFPDSTHVWYIKILMWLRGFLILFSIFGLVFFVLKSPLGTARQWRLQKFAILTLKSQSHVRILIYRTWTIKSKDYFGEGGGGDREAREMTNLLNNYLGDKQAQGVNDIFNWRVFCFHFSHSALP